MKTHPLTIVFFVTLFAACSSKPKHDHDVYANLLVGVNEPLYAESRILNSYLSITGKIVREELVNGFKGAAPGLADSIKIYDSIFNAIVNTDIPKIEALRELDNDLKIKELTLAYLRHFNPFMTKTTPFLIKICANGVKKNDQPEYNQIMASVHKLTGEGDELLKIKYKFQDKYKITDAELTKHGLDDN